MLVNIKSELKLEAGYIITVDPGVLMSTVHESIRAETASTSTCLFSNLNRGSKTPIHMTRKLNFRHIKVKTK